MRTLFFSISLILCTCARAQLDVQHEEVRATVQAYIDGTSYNRPELLEESFHPAISMYFSKKSKNWMPAREEYIGFFGGDDHGKPTGRRGNIRLIEVSGDVATAKAEILIPAQQWLFIDYFLLKRIEGKWWIVAKSASSGPSEQSGKRILMVVSNARYYGDTDLPTANHFGEIAAAYRVFTEAGYTVDLASPDGGAVGIDHLSSVDSTTAPYLRDAEFWYRLEQTRMVSKLEGADYEAVYFPGGGAAMFGIADNVEVQRLIREIYTGQGVVAAVCHGTAGITNTTLSDGTPLLQGLKVTGFPDDRELKDRAYYHTFPLHIDARVAAQGGEFLGAAATDSGFFVTDGRLVTGMDHSATALVAEEVVHLLGEEVRK